MKKVFDVLSIILLSFFLFAACANNISEKNEILTSLVLSQSEKQQYGSIRINTGNATRSIDNSIIKKAVVTVYSSDFKLNGVEIDICGGSGSVTIENIPVGANRIIEVQAFSETEKLEGVILRTVADIHAGLNEGIDVNWETSKKGNVFAALLSNKVEISRLSPEQVAAIEDAIPNIHANLINVTQIALDFKSDALGNYENYMLKTGNLKISGTNLEGHDYIFALNDITTQNSKVEKSSQISVLPGKWILSIYDGNELVKAENIIVKSEKNTEISVTGSVQGSVDTSKIKVHVPVNLGLNYVYSWKDEEKFSGVWPGTQMKDLDSDGTYDFTIEQIESNIIFNNKSGTQTSDLKITGGEWNYVGGLPGKGNASDWELLGTAPVEFSLKVINPVAPKVSLTNSCNFADSKKIKISETGCTLAKYTVDGSDPKTSSTAIEFSGDKTVEIGKDNAIGETITVKAYGTDGEDESSDESSFVKIEREQKSETPNRLGAYYRKTDTQFTIWSPDSSDVTVTVTPIGGEAKVYICEKNYAVNGNYPDAENIYGVKVSGDLRLAEYQFNIAGKPVLDPYSKMVKYDGNQQKSNKLGSGTENGFAYTSYLGPTVNIVMDMDETEPEGGWAERPALENRCDSIIYEIHVADFSSDSTWGGSAQNAGKFTGMVESGTSYESVKTGFDHIKEMGVTHVQILPMYDFATKFNETLNDIYNWGYDPVNYNVPEDRYSTCPENYEERIREVKEMINEFHKNGIRVIMDVVYNHTYGKEVFKDISSRYYTETDLSGCGNSVNTGIPMISRFIQDSLEYWADEYNIDGFRFDLIGIYHTEEVKKWGEYLNNTKFPDRNLLMYGEPWNGYATDSEESKKIRMSAVASLGNAHVGVFNGKFRQSLKGSNDNGKAGYIFNKNDDDGSAYAANIAVGLKGSGTSLDKNGCSDGSGTWTRFFTVSPDQSINYMFAHDNLNAADKIKISSVATVGSEYFKQINRFGHGILLVSQGIPFIHAGDEFLRTKEKGAGAEMSHNSYMAGTETNAIDWSLKETNINEFNYFKDLIEIRKENDGLRNRNGVGKTNANSDNSVEYYVENTDGTKLCIVVNPGNSKDSPVSGTVIADFKGKTDKATSSECCTGTGVTIIKY